MFKYFLTLFLFTYAMSTLKASQAQTVPENLTLKEIFLEPVIPGIRPTMRSLSLDQSRLYFTWNDSSYYETGLYSVDMDGTFDIKKEDEDSPSKLLSPDGNRIAFTDDGSIFVANRDGSDSLKIVTTQEREFGLQWSPDSKKIAFIRAGDVWVSHVDSPGIIQVTKRSDQDPVFMFSSWVGTDKLLVQQSDSSDALTVYFPDYLGKMVTAGATQRGIPSTTIYAASLDTTKLDTLLTGVHRSSTTTSSTGRFAAIDYMDAALKHRKLIVHNLDESSNSVVFKDSTSGWLHHTY